MMAYHLSEPRSTAPESGNPGELRVEPTDKDWDKAWLSAERTNISPMWGKG